MKANPTIAQIAASPQFGINALLTRHADVLAELRVTTYTVDTTGAILTLTRTNGSGRQRVRMVADPSNVDKVSFLSKLQNFYYGSMDSLNQATLKADLLPLYKAQMQQQVNYGSEPEIVSITPLANKKVRIRFKAKRGSREQLHEAVWTKADPETDFNNTVTVPQGLYQSTDEFLQLAATTLKVDVSRLEVTREVKGSVEEVKVHFKENDLAYSGAITFNVPTVGDRIIVTDKVTGEEVIPVEEGNDEDDQLLDDGQGNILSAENGIDLTL